MKKTFKFLLKLLILSYQKIVSPWTPPSCRYDLTCSNYAIEAINKHGPYKGFWLAVKRVITCHPWGGKGHKSVP